MDTWITLWTVTLWASAGAFFLVAAYIAVTALFERKPAPSDEA